MKYARSIGFVLAVACCLMPVVALAQAANAANAANATTNMTSIDAKAIPELIRTISTWLRVIAYTASVGTFIYAGILYFNSTSNPAGTGTAKNAIKAVLIGLTIVVLSEVIVRTTLGFVTQPNNQQGIDKILHNGTP